MLPHGTFAFGAWIVVIGPHLITGYHLLQHVDIALLSIHGKLKPISLTVLSSSGVVPKWMTHASSSIFLKECSSPNFDHIILLT